MEDNKEDVKETKTVEGNGGTGEVDTNTTNQNESTDDFYIICTPAIGFESKLLASIVIFLSISI